MAGEVRNISFNLQKSRQSIIRPSNTTAYAAGDVISEVSTNDHFTFKILKAVPGHDPILSCTIERATIVTSADVSTAPDLELWLFDTDITEVADNGLFIPTDTEIKTWLTTIEFPVEDFKVGLVSGDGNQVCETNPINRVIKGIAASGGNIYGQLVVRNAYVPISAEEFTVTLYYQLD